MAFFIVKVADEVAAGDFQGALKTLTSGAVKTFEELPVWLQSFLGKLGGQEQTILSGLVSTAVSALMTDIQNPSQLTSAQISAQAQAIYQQLVQQNVSTFTLQDVFSALNAALSTQVAVPATTGPASGG